MGRFFRWIMSLFQKKIKQNRDYEITVIDEDTAIKILRGKYKDIVYKYEKMSIKDDSPEMPILSFHYTILNTSNFTDMQLRDDTRFHTLIGDIIVDLLLSKAVEREKYESDREDYPEELGI